MCKMFEKITGRKSKGSVDKLEGLTKAYTDRSESIAILNIPVELMEIDTRYQTDERTERDLENLRRYLYLKMSKNGASEDSVKECFTSKDGKRDKYVFDGVTAGHEVMIFWNYDEDWFWVYNDGSINGYCDFFQREYYKAYYTKGK